MDDKEFDKLVKAVREDPEIFDKYDQEQKEKENKYRQGLSEPLRERYDKAVNEYLINQDKFTNYKQLKEGILDKEKDCFFNPYKKIQGITTNKIIGYNSLSDSELSEVLEVEGYPNADKEIYRRLRPHKLYSLIHLSFLSALKQLKIKTYEDWEKLFNEETLIALMIKEIKNIDKMNPAELSKLSKDLWDFKYFESDQNDTNIYSGILDKYSNSLLEIEQEHQRAKAGKEAIEKGYNGNFLNSLRELDKRRTEKEGIVKNEVIQKASGFIDRLKIDYNFNAKLITDIDNPKIRKAIDYIVSKIINNKSDIFYSDEISKTLAEKTDTIPINKKEMLQYIRPDIDLSKRYNLREIGGIIDTLKETKIQVKFKLNTGKKNDYIVCNNLLLTIIERPLTKEVFIGCNPEIIKKVFPYNYDRPSFICNLIGSDYDLLCEISNRLNMNFKKQKEDFIILEAYEVFQKVYKIYLHEKTDEGRTKESNPERYIQKFLDDIDTINKDKENNEIEIIILDFDKGNRKQYKINFMDNAKLKVIPKGKLKERLLELRDYRNSKKNEEEILKNATNFINRKRKKNI